MIPGMEMNMRDARLKAGAKDDMLRRKNDKEISPDGDVIHGLPVPHGLQGRHHQGQGKRPDLPKDR